MSRDQLEFYSLSEKERNTSLARPGFVVTHLCPVRSPRRSRRRDCSKKKKKKIQRSVICGFIFVLIWANGKFRFC